MAKKRKKYGKMNLTLEPEFYEFLRKKAKEEHLPISTFVKKFLLDRMDEYTIGEDVQ